MKCKKCGIEFEGKFCPECGTKNTHTPGETASAEKNKKTKPFYLKWWFILIIVLALVIGIPSIAGNGEKIVWNDFVLQEKIPEAPGKKGEIHNNTAEKLWVYIYKLSEKEYVDYVELCKNSGYTIDADSGHSSSYTAFNSQGYKLDVSYYSSSKEMSITLNAPMEMNAITWPTSVAGKQLPAPKSTIGKFSYEYDDHFFVYIGNTSKSDFEAYVNTCKEHGFTVDYNKGETYYFADNALGWQLSIKYEGNNTISIDIDAPEETTVPESTQSQPSLSSNSSTIGTEFKSAMDSYESFINEYVEFMKKYSKNPTDFSLLTDYSRYMSEYATFVEDFENWEDEEMNTAELAYYVEVQARVTKKLLEIA